MSKMNPMDVLNSIREKAKLGDNNDFSKSIAIKLGKPGKIKLQLLALNPDNLFKPRTQHAIPVVPHEEDKNEKWLVADCKGNGCPVCIAASAFKQATNVTVDDINEAYKPKFPYKNIRSLFTQPEHYILCAKVLEDKADDGTYLPKDAEIGSTQLIQFSRMALNSLMSAYEDFIDDADGEDVPPLFAIFDDSDTTKSLTITCRITNQPYTCSFSFNKAIEVSLSDVDEDKIKFLEEDKEVSAEHYEKCVKRIKAIQNYFVGANTAIDDIDTLASTEDKKDDFTSTDDILDGLDLDID